MSKTKNDIPATVNIESGKPIEIKADSRKDATQQLNELRKQAETEGLTPKEGGFIEHREGAFSAVITFV